MTLSRHSTLWVPGPLPGMNDIIALCNAGKKKYNPWNTHKQRWQHSIELLAATQGLRSVQPCCWTWVHFESSRRRDPSNLTAGAQKVIEDALQEAKLLENDGWEHILDFKHWWVVDKDKPGTLVVFSDRILGREEARALRPHNVVL